MSGPTNRRFVRSAWTLLAFQFVAAAGALALAIWAATKVQHLVDQRDLLQARVTSLEAHQRQMQAIPPPIEEAQPVQTVPVTPTPTPTPTPPAPAVSTPPIALPPVVVHRGGSASLPPPVIVDEGTPPPRRPVHLPPPGEPPVTEVPPRPPVIVRPLPGKPVRQPIPNGSVPTRPVGTVPPMRRPNSSAAVPPTRPNGTTIARPTRPAATQPQASAPAAARPAPTNVRRIDPNRIRRPRPTDTSPPQNPIK